MHPLNRKLLRDMGKMKGQTLAVGLVMACGLAMMIMARSLIFSLESTRDEYYDEIPFCGRLCGFEAGAERRARPACANRGRGLNRDARHG